MMSLECMSAKPCCSTDTVIYANIFYEKGSSCYLPALRENATTIRNLLATIGADCVIEIDVKSSSSPEGNTDLNYLLSNQRNNTALELIKDLNGFEDAKIRVSSMGTDWAGLANLVETSNMWFADEAAYLIRNTPEWIKRDSIVVDSRKLRLRMLYDNRPWQYMEENIFPDLRVSNICIKYKKKIANNLSYIPQVIDIKSETPRCNVDTLISRCLSYTITQEHISKATTGVGVKTNLLYDLVAIPNLSMELFLPKGWTIGIGGMYAWWSKKNMDKIWRIQGAEISIKKYIGFTTPRLASGWYIGCYANIGRYDILLGNTGYLSGNSNGNFFNHPSYGFGVEGGYSFPISKRFYLDFSIGVGYLTGQYLTYKSQAGHNIWESTRIRHWFGPTKAEISLVLLLKKGGKR